MQLFGERLAVFAAALQTLLGGKTVDLPFDIEQGIDPFDGLPCHWRDRRGFTATFGVRGWRRDQVVGLEQAVDRSL